MNKMGSRKTVSVAVLTYYPDREKLFMTIRSILEQKNIQCQVVVSDDGSDENYFEDLRIFFAENQFDNYRLIENPNNQGTVKNCLAAVDACTEKYVKTISPGDFFASENCLSEWVDFMEQEKTDWSFCEVSYYRLNDCGKTEFLEHFTHPQNIRPYVGTRSAKKEEKCKWNYVVLRDVCLGAATLCKREVLEKYLREIAGEIIYTEDTIYRLMMFDGMKVCYFAKPAVMYEYGTGISTSGNVCWSERISADWEKTTRMLLNRCADNAKDKKYYKAISIMDGKKRGIAKLSKCLIPGYLEHKMRILFFQRKSKPFQWWS